MKISVIGMGYVGCVTAVGFSQCRDVKVVGIESKPEKVASINSGKAPFYEPGLDALLQQAVTDGSLYATERMMEVRGSDIIFICVGTPSVPGSGGVDTVALDRVLNDVSQHLEEEGVLRPCTVVIRSTVPPGTTFTAKTKHFADKPYVEVVHNPEFLREGRAVEDFEHPSLVVIGDPDQSRSKISRLHCLYQALYATAASPPPCICIVGPLESEMLKYATNAFHAVKITFANEIAKVCSVFNANSNTVMGVLKTDTVLNASGAYLRPGFAFGGSCLPKDLRALETFCSCSQIETPLLESVRRSNQICISDAAEFILKELRAHSSKNKSPVVGIPSMRFSAVSDTEDIRESPMVQLAKEIQYITANPLYEGGPVEVIALIPCAERDDRTERVEGIRYANSWQELCLESTIVVTQTPVDEEKLIAKKHLNLSLRPWRIQ